VVAVRLARPEDEGLLLHWANDPLARRMSFHPDPITPEEHTVWFRNVLSGSRATQLIVETLDGTPVGQVRIGQDGEISISLAAERRGRGLAAPSLRAALDWARRELGLARAVARIKPDNEASIKVFEAVGFRCEGETLVAGQRCLTYVKSLG
jgi:RimJ/RimL family protein N-acetyltransferase